MFPCFSVVTVCRNAERVIGTAAASVRRQRFTDYEWLVVDGASTDATADEVRKAGVPNTRLISEPDRGIYDAMNKAVRLARGEYLFFLNADDRFHDDDVLADVGGYLAARPDVDFLYGDVVIERLSVSELKRQWYINRMTILFEDLCHQAVFARRSLFDRVGGFELRWPTSADYDWFLRVFRHGARATYLDRRIAYFTAGGAHARDVRALSEERKAIRLQYMSRSAFVVGVFASRARHRLSRVLRRRVRPT